MEQEPQRSVAPIGWSRRIAAWPIVAYRLTLSRFLGGQCRFMPSCSTYGLEAVQQHGAIKGWWMAVGRICRCHPFHPGGYDPVPPVCEPGRSKQTVGLHSSSGKVDSLP